MRRIYLTILAVVALGTNFVTAQENTETVAKDYKWQVRLRGVGVVPTESASIGVIGGDVSISNQFIPELDFTYFFTKNIAAN